MSPKDIQKLIVIHKHALLEADTIEEAKFQQGFIKALSAVYNDQEIGDAFS